MQEELQQEFIPEKEIIPEKILTKEELEGPILKEFVIAVNRVTKVVAGGKRLSFNALVCVGDGKGNVGLGFGKAAEVLIAIEKARRRGIKNIFSCPIINDTIPYKVFKKFGASKILLRPAGIGTGIRAAFTVRAILECAGYKNVLTKSLGSTNPFNLAYATVEALKELKTKEESLKLRKKDLTVGTM